MDALALLDDLRKGFIRYEHNLEDPMNPKSEEELLIRYMTDVAFRCRVDNLVSGVYGIVEKYIKEDDHVG